MKQIVVRVPASLANLGPGFDSLALAVELHNRLSIEPLDSGLEVHIQGEGQGALAADESNLILAAARTLAEAHGRALPGLQLTCHNRIPLGAGLGSSAAAIVAGLLAADALLEMGMPRPELLRWANRLEGHPDNVAAALFGGLVIVGADADRPITRRVEPAVAELVVVIPELDLPTQRMREVLPQTVPLEDAAFNLGRTALTIEALRSADYSLLAQAMVDRLHQPYRQAHLPGFAEVVEVAHQAGAAAVALAGAGPGLVAFAEHDLAGVGAAMSAAFRGHGVPAGELVLAVDRQGAQVAIE